RPVPAIDSAATLLVVWRLPQGRKPVMRWLGKNRCRDQKENTTRTIRRDQPDRLTFPRQGSDRGNRSRTAPSRWKASANESHESGGMERTRRRALTRMRLLRSHETGGRAA